MTDTPQPAPSSESSSEDHLGLPIRETAPEAEEAPPPSTELSSQLITQPPPPPQRDRTVFMPPIDIYDSGEGLVLLADLPGVTIETLEIQVQDNRLTLYGRVTPALPVEARLIHQEFEWGDFLRSFILSDEVDHDRITAKLNNGVLEVVLPRMPKAEPRRIQVNRE